MADDVFCPRCRTTKYRNPNLTLLVNVCGHALCENCVDLLFVRGSGNCPVCGVTLRRTNFRAQFFEDASIDKEMDIRKKILKDFNKKEDDFPTLREYNDYLEEVESIINDIDVESTRWQVETYKKENKELIAKNKFKKSADDLFIENCLAIENSKKANTANSDQWRKLALERLEKEREQQSLIDDLMFSDAPAQDILQSHNEIQRLKEQQSEEAAKAEELAKQAASIANKFGQNTTFAPIPRKADVLYHYIEPTIDYLGPEPPNLDDVLHKGYLRNMRRATGQEKAGGYEAHLGCIRALQAAVDGLFLGEETHFPSPSHSNPTSSGDSSVGMDMD